MRSRDFTVSAFPTNDEVRAAKALLDQNSHEVGFVTYAAFTQAAEKSELFVAIAKRVVVGFVRFHFRRDGRVTVYEIATKLDYRKNGVGRALLHTLREAAHARGYNVIQLKCPEAGEANAFYAHIGFTRHGVEKGRKRRLCVWRMETEMRVANAICRS